MYNLASWNIRGMNLLPKQKEVRQVISDNHLSICSILESHVPLDRLASVCSFVFCNWNWTSNGSMCAKYPQIIIGWNPADVDLMVISQSDQVIHAQVFLKKVKKVLMCSFVFLGKGDYPG